MKRLLLEIGLQDRPAEIAKQLISHLSEKVDYFLRNKFCFTQHQITTYYTHRRIALLVENFYLPDDITHLHRIDEQSLDRDKGTRKFLKSLRITLPEVTIIEDDIGKVLSYQSTGMHKLTLMIKHCFSELESRFKLNCTGSVQWLCCILDREVLPITHWNITSTKMSYGTRLTSPIEMIDAAEYEPNLLRHGIIPRYSDREHKIKTLIQSYRNFVPVVEQIPLSNLIDNTEIVNVFECEFHEKFLFMQDIIEYFVKYVLSKKHSCIFFYHATDRTITNKFLVVTNVLGDHNVIAIYWAKVINDLLENIYFFYQLDGPSINLSDLKRISFSESLGSVYDQMTRIISILKNMSLVVQFQLEKTITACQYCKCDLTKTIVQEYPDLCYLMSAHYASIHGIAKDTVEIIKSLSIMQWYDNGSVSTLTAEAKILNIVLHLEYIISTHISFKVLSDTTLTLDPFEIRRYSNRLICLLKHIDVNLEVLVSHAINAYPKEYLQLQDICLYFFKERIKSHYSHEPYYQYIPISVRSNVYQIEMSIQHWQNHQDALGILTQMAKRIKSIIKNQPLPTNFFDLRSCTNQEKLLYEMLFQQQLSFPQTCNHTVNICLLLEELFKDHFILHTDPVIKNNRLMILHNTLRMILSLISIS